MLDFGLEFGAALCGFLYMEEGSTLLEVMAGCACPDQMCSSAGAGHCIRFQYYVCLPSVL